MNLAEHLPALQVALPLLTAPLVILLRTGFLAWLAALLASLFSFALSVQLTMAVLQGGTSFDEQYKNVNGESGYFSQSLNAYGQSGLPCGRCGGEIRRQAWANRGSHFCPRCQKLRKG